MTGDAPSTDVQGRAALQVSGQQLPLRVPRPDSEAPGSQEAPVTALRDRIESAIVSRPDLEDDDIAVGVMRSFGEKASLERAVEPLVTAEVALVRSARAGVPKFVTSAARDERLLTAADVADLCHVSTMTVYRWVADGYIAAVRLGAKGQYRFRRSAVEVLLATEASA